MNRGKSKILPIVLLAIIAVVTIIIMVSIGRSLLNRGTQEKVVDDSSSRALLATEADRSVRMSVRGPIVANENFRSYEIEVSPIGRRLTTHKGYLGEIIEDNRLENNNEAYTEFVNALNRAEFTKLAEVSEEIKETEGLCATGRLYTFEILQAQSVVKKTWASSCRDIPGSFRGDAVLVRDLFQDQIPDGKKLLRDLDI